MDIFEALVLPSRRRRDVATVLAEGDARAPDLAPRIADMERML